MSDLVDRLAQLSPEKRALLARRLAETSAAGPRVPEPIAIIGLGCRFPGADGVDAYWQLLASRTDAISEVPAERWSSSELYDPDPAAAGKVATRWGGFLSGIDRFDPYFFGISPREAARMDPQQRLWLETAWEAFEHAGLTMEALEGSHTGVFLGLHSHSSDYFWLQLGAPERMDAFTGPGNAHNIAAGRLAYLFDLRGPAITVDTACSASLVAIHMACQSLRAGDCRTAIAGGVNAMLSPIWSIPLSRMQMLSPTGRCRAFDAAADGFVRGEGAGAVVLKRLSDAIADGDTVLAVIRGSAVNQDGRTNGITAPNGLSQRALLRDALKNAGVRAADVTHVETHGTGTAVGDPIELEAIAEVLGEGRTDGQPCWLGAAKSNFGHLEGAAGVAGLIKVVLSLQRRQIPPVCHFTNLNPGISVDLRRFPVPTRVETWDAQRRIAGVSSFGWSGTNVHVIVEEAPEQPAVEPPTAGPSVLTISARSDEALRASAARHRDFLAGEPCSDGVADICRTAALRRSHFEHRLTVVGDSQRALADGLESFLAGGKSWTVASGKMKGGRAPSVAFVYSGQGPQWAGMGRELLEREPVFRRAMEHCDALVTSITAWSVIDDLSAPQERSRLDRTAVAQPVLFSLQMALTELWKSWGIRPAAVVGHSVGEIAAAWCAGALSLEQAAKIAVLRGDVMDRATGQGRMLSVELPVPEIRRIVTNWRGLDVAAINGPRSVVLSGDTTDVERAATLLTAHEVVTRYLPVQYAFHSHQMEALSAELVRTLGDVPAKDGEIPFISTVTGEALAGRHLSGAYWGRNVRETVRFADAIASLAAQHPIFLEIAPHPVLRQSIAESGGAETRIVCSLHRGRDGRAAMLTNLGSLHTAGCAVNWPAVFPGAGRTVPLPSYPWQRERYWLDHVVPYSGTRRDAADVSRDTGTADGSAEPGDGLLYAPVWTASEPGAEAASGDEAFSNTPGRWLIFADRGGLGAHLVAALQRRGHSCVVEYAKRADASGLDPADREALAAACLRLATPGGLPWRGIVHLWSLDAPQEQGTSAPALEQAQLESCGAVLGIVQALTLVGGSVPTVWIATRGAHAVGDERAAPSPVQAPVWGLARTLAIEHPNLRCVRVDLPADARASVGALMSELVRETGDAEVAFRAGRRYVPRLRRVLQTAPSAVTFDPDATYLVTGGLGAIGLETATWLVARGARHLVLTGRSGANEAAQARLARLRFEGASIDVVRADVSQKQDVDRLIAAIAATPYPLRGIFHSAGVLDDGVALQQDWTRLRTVLAPKLKGAWNLHLASAGLPLDQFVLYSSLASLLGSAGQSNYAAANAFLDALAHMRRAQSLAALSVNWGAWGGSGMAAALDEAGQRRLMDAGIGTMEADAAFAGLEGAMASGVAQVGVLAIDWDRYARYRGVRDGFFADLSMPASPAPDAAARPDPFLPALLQDAPDERRRTVILQHVRREALAVLGVPPSHALDDEQGLRDAGLDSLMALELKNRLQTTTGLTLPTTLAFDYPTAAALTDFLAGRLGVTAAPVEDARSADAATDLATADLESMSEDEAAALLAEELAALQRSRTGASGVKRG